MLESGDRTRPSPQLIAALATALALPSSSRAALFHAAGIAAPVALPADRIDPDRLPFTMAETLSCPAFVIDAFWAIHGWNHTAPPALETFAAALPAGALSLVELLYQPELRSRILNWEELIAHLAASFKRDTRGLTNAVRYRDAVRALRRLPGFPTVLRNADPSAPAVTTGMLGFRHGHLGPLWFAEALTTFHPACSLRVLAYVPADPATSSAVERLVTGIRAQPADDER
jgi:hypothetical protein